MPRTHREFMNSLPEERRARIEAEAARLLAELDQQEEERAMIRQAARFVADVRKSGRGTAVKIESRSGRDVTLTRPLDALKLRRRHHAA